MQKFRKITPENVKKDTQGNTGKFEKNSGNDSGNSHSQPTLSFSNSNSHDKTMKISISQILLQT